MSARQSNPYLPQQKEGEQADPGVKCPYGLAEIGAMCSWLAGHYDKHGLEAWEKTRR